MAEQCGLMPALGEWVLREACAAASAWPLATRLAVNVSPVQFAQVDLPQLLGRIMEETGVDPRRIDLEITETAVIRDLDGARRVFAELQSIGAHVVLDDFGAGYASLQLLSALPFDKIKIDRSLLPDLGRSARTDAIIAAILSLARTLRLRVTVEGVETEEQLGLLRQQTCDELQGFLLGRPRPLPAVAGVRPSPAAADEAPSDRRRDRGG
jgi:EAL domain-containing protein (putative c-di-GMP-specific phosphodiesterase class I)